MFGLVGYLGMDWEGVVLGFCFEEVGEEGRCGLGGCVSGVASTF